MVFISHTKAPANGAVQKSASYNSTSTAAPLNPNSGRDTSFSFDRSSPALSHQQSWLSFDFAEQTPTEIMDLAGGLNAEPKSSSFDHASDSAKYPTDWPIVTNRRKFEPREPKIPNFMATHDLASFALNGPRDINTSRSLRVRGEDQKTERRKFLTSGLFKRSPRSPKTGSSPRPVSAQETVRGSFIPGSHCEQKVTTDGRKYIQIIPSISVEEPTPAVEPTKRELPTREPNTDSSDENVVLIETLDQWITDFCLSDEPTREPSPQSKLRLEDGLDPLEHEKPVNDSQHSVLTPTRPPSTPVVDASCGFGLSIITDDASEEVNPLRSHPPSTDSTSGHSRGISTGTDGSSFIEPDAAIELATRVVVERSTSITHSTSTKSRDSNIGTIRRRTRGGAKVDSLMDDQRNEDNKEEAVYETALPPLESIAPTHEPKLPQSSVQVSQSELPTPSPQDISPRVSANLERPGTAISLNAKLVPQRASSLSPTSRPDSRTTSSTRSRSRASQKSRSIESPITVVTEESEFPTKLRHKRRSTDLVLNEKRLPGLFPLGLRNEFATSPGTSTTQISESPLLGSAHSYAPSPTVPPFKRLTIPRGNFSAVGSSRPQSLAQPAPIRRTFPAFEEPEIPKGPLFHSTTSLAGASPSPAPNINPPLTPNPTPGHTPSGRYNLRMQQQAHAVPPVPRSSSLVSRLEDRIMALERENKLLNAALMAVLRTGGLMNGCPCSVLNERDEHIAEDGFADGVHARDYGMNRRSMQSQSSEMTNDSVISVLDVYFRTRLGNSSPGVAGA